MRNKSLKFIDSTSFRWIYNTRIEQMTAIKVLPNELINSIKNLPS